MRLSKLCALLFPCCLLGCPPSSGGGVDPVPQPEPQPSVAPAPTGKLPVGGPFKPAVDDDVKKLVASNGAFARNLYADIAKSQTGNFAFSPSSISIALAMTYAGAQGETATAMAKSLELTTDSDTTHRAYGTLLRSWVPSAAAGGKSKADYELRVANRLFGSDAISFSPDFEAVTKDHYLAPMEKLDFLNKTEASRKHINGWVEGQTNNRIQDLLAEGGLKPDALLVLVNAVYFNGTWTEKFEPSATKSAPFFAAGGEVAVPTMHQETRLPYAEVDGNKIIQMSYRGGSMAMTIILPDDKDGLPATEKAIAEGKLDTWLTSFRTQRVSIALPKFKIAGSSMSLKDTLGRLGMGVAFDANKANFRGMAAPGGPNLFIGAVLHKTFVDVHEKGTEAAASTAVVMYPTSAELPSEPKPFVADHPFVFMIRDAHKGSILFMGRVADPS